MTNNTGENIIYDNIENKIILENIETNVVPLREMIVPDNAATNIIHLVDVSSLNVQNKQLQKCIYCGCTCINKKERKSKPKVNKYPRYRTVIKDNSRAYYYKNKNEISLKNKEKYQRKKLENINKQFLSVNINTEINIT